MGTDIRDVELKENSINSLLIDDLLSHPILIKRRPYWGILKINCVLGLLALWVAHCIVILKQCRMRKVERRAVNPVITTNIWLPCLYVD